MTVRRELVRLRPLAGLTSQLLASRPSSGKAGPNPFTEQVERVSRFVWLRQFEVGKNSADMNRLLDRLEFLQGLELSADVLKEVPPHRIARLRRLGERYFTDDLRDVSGDRRLAILAICAVE